MEEHEAAIGQILAKSAKTISTAESCSGGLIAHRLTNVPGSSAYFLGGVVSYSNGAKESLLGVSAVSLETHGAVSEAVAKEMAEGVRNRFGSDYGVACTGIAGPGGGSEEKPVGLVYIGVSGPDGTNVNKCNFNGDRLNVKTQTADKALSLLKGAIA